MSETISNNEVPEKISARDEISQFAAEKARLAYLESLVGDGLDQTRNDEAADYSAHLESMLHRDKGSEYDASTEIGQDDDINLANYDLQLRRLDMMANSISDLQSRIDASPDKEKLNQVLADKEAKFQEVFDKYENSGQVTDHEYKILENILQKAYSEKTTVDVKEQKDSDDSVETQEPVEVDEVLQNEKTEQDDQPESNKINEKDAEALPKEEKAIVKSAIDRARDLYYKAGALFGTAIDKTSEFFMPKQRSLESPWEYEDRLKRETFFKAVGLTALTAIVLVAGHEIFQAAGAGHSVDSSNSANGITSPEHYDFSSAASHVDSGEGWYQTFKDMGIPKDEWSGLLHKVGPKLESSGYAYRMGNSFGISHPGELPKKVLELIQNSR